MRNNLLESIDIFIQLISLNLILILCKIALFFFVWNKNEKKIQNIAVKFLSFKNFLSVCSRQKNNPSSAIRRTKIVKGRLRATIFKSADTADTAQLIASLK